MEATIKFDIPDNYQRFEKTRTINNTNKKNSHEKIKIKHII